MVDRFQRGFGTGAEQREADRFYADLMGQPSASTPATAPRAGAGGGAGWVLVAVPGAMVPAQALRTTDLVARWGAGTGPAGYVGMLGDFPAVYGRDGRIRPDVVILRRARGASAEDVPEMADERAQLNVGHSGDPVGGRAFMRSMPGAGEKALAGGGSDWVARENALVGEIVRGNMPSAQLILWNIDLPAVTLRKGKPNERTITGSVQVLVDYLCIGTDSDWLHAPLDPVSAQTVADRLNLNLPTARICHAIYQAPGATRIGAIPRDYYLSDGQRKTAKPGRAQTSTEAYIEHSEAIQKAMQDSGIKPGTLVVGHKKDVVLARDINKPQNATKIAFQGFYDSAGSPMEPCGEKNAPQPCQKDLPTLAHPTAGRHFSDYSQGVRLVDDGMVVDGQPRSMRQVLVHPEDAYLISAEGPIDPPRIA